MTARAAYSGPSNRAAQRLLWVAGRSSQRSEFGQLLSCRSDHAKGQETVKNVFGSLDLTAIGIRHPCYRPDAEVLTVITVEIVLVFLHSLLCTGNHLFAKAGEIALHMASTSLNPR
jgi:hypothetical protein